MGLVEFHLFWFWGGGTGRANDIDQFGMVVPRSKKQQTLYEGNPPGSFYCSESARYYDCFGGFKADFPKSYFQSVLRICAWLRSPVLCHRRTKVRVQIARFSKILKLRFVNDKDYFKTKVV